MNDGFSRRDFARLALAAVPGLSSLAFEQKPPVRRGGRTPLPRAGEFYRFLDGQTEQPVVRLTSLASSSYLPPAVNRSCVSREKFLLFASDRDGALAPYTMDLRTGVAMQAADPDRMVLQSLQLTASGRSALFVDGNVLTEVSLPGGRKTTVLGEGITAVSTATEYVFVRGGKVFRSGRTEPLAVGAAPDFCLLHPKRPACLFTREEAGKRELWAVTWNEGPPRSLRLASGPLTNACWAPDGRSVFFLRTRMGNGGQEETIMAEVALDENGARESLVARTSRFAAFAPNNDASVFVGASASKAQPSVLLLLRSVGRELTLCEHRAKNAWQVQPVFSPDNRRVYFASDFQGRPAVYAVNVELLVEPAPSS